MHIKTTAVTIGFMICFGCLYSDAYASGNPTFQSSATAPGATSAELLADNYCHINVTYPTDGIAAEAQGRFGYYARADGNADAGFELGALYKDVLFFSYGHGLEGGGGIATGSIMVTAQNGGIYPNLCDHVMPRGQLAIMAACFTDDTDTSSTNYGCIDQTMKQIGATCVVGFHGYGPDFYANDPSSPHRWWTLGLWDALTGYGTGKENVSDALNYAKSFTYNECGQYFDTNDYMIRGDASYVLPNYK